MTDRENIINHFQDAIEASGSNNSWRFVRVDMIESAIELLKEQEPAIVRCKDCKHYDGKDCTLQKWDWWAVSPNWFCGDGERR